MSDAELAQLLESIRLLREVVENLAENIAELSDAIRRIELL